MKTITKFRFNLIGAAILTAVLVSTMAGCATKKTVQSPAAASVSETSTASQDLSSKSSSQTSSAEQSSETVSSEKSASSSALAVSSEAKANTFSVKTINKSTTESNIKIETAIPVFSGFTACDTLNSKINKTVSDEIKTQKKNVDDLNSPNLKGLAYHSTYAYHINGNILSVWLTIYENNAGVHGNTYIHAFNMNTKSGEFYNTPYSMFQGQSAAKSEIINDVIAQFKKTVPAGDLMNQAIQQIKDANGNFKFYIENKNLVIYFDEYEIMPYAYGRPTLKLPLSSLKAKLVNS